MASYFLDRLAAMLGNAFQGLRFVPYRPPIDGAIDLEELVTALLHKARQMNRARIECLHRSTTLERLQALWRQQFKEIDILLRQAALPERMNGSVLAERAMHNLHTWNRSAQACCRLTLKVTELRDLQYRLEDLADALLVYARAEHDQWCDTQPMV